jgi:hypothetical protein
MEKIGDILQKKYQKQSALTLGQMQSVTICSFWDKVMGAIEEKYVTESKALSFKNGLLTIGVSHSGVMMEMQFLELIILEKYEEILGSRKVEKIKFKNGMS